MEIKEFDKFENLTEENLESINGGFNVVEEFAHLVGYTVGMLSEGWTHVYG